MENHARLNRLFQIQGRQAKPASVSFNLLKTFVQAVLMWTVFLVILPVVVLQIEDKVGVNQFRFHFSGQFIAGLALFILGWIVSWTSAYFMAVRGEGTPLPMDATRMLVVTGPYRFIRNPMAFSSLAQGAAVGLTAGSPLILIYVALGVVAWNCLARPWEEADLTRKFGEEYLEYHNEVRCWAPRLRPYSPENHHVLPSRSTVSAT